MTEERTQKNNLALQPYQDRPVGCPPDPDLSAMTIQDLDTRRETVGRLRELCKKAEKGTQKTVPEIREILQDRPELAWRLMEFSRSAESRFIDTMTKDQDLAAKALMERQLADMRQEIAGENPSPLERLLAERIVLTWLQIQLFEGAYAGSMLKSMTLAQGTYQQKRLDQTYRRHLSAIRSLAQIRKLGPAVQINIAEKQINTAG